MHEIKSNLTGETIHIICRAADIEPGRCDAVSPEHKLQMATLKVGEKKFKAHRHKPKWDFQDGYITQESWVVISGAVEFTPYDTDLTEMEKHRLGPGDCVVSLLGGHNYEILEPDTIVYEFKNGPYTGVEDDKEWI